jgi:hypothetical protein
MSEDLKALPRGGTRRAALASFYSALTPEDKRYMNETFSASVPEEFGDQLEKTIRSELNLLRTKLVHLHKQMPGDSTAAKFVNDNGELQLRSSEEEKGLYEAHAPTLWRMCRVSCASDCRLSWIPAAEVAFMEGATFKSPSGRELEGDDLKAAVDGANESIDRAALKMMDVSIESRTAGGVGIGALSHGAVKAACAMKFGGLAESIMDGFSAGSTAAGRDLVDQIDKEMAARYKEAYVRLMITCIDEKKSWMRMRDNMNKVHNR